jgi:hypothetical protein
VNVLRAFRAWKVAQKLYSTRRYLDSRLMFLVDVADASGEHQLANRLAEARRGWWADLAAIAEAERRERARQLGQQGDSKKGGGG